jgi:DNA-binding PadR family transcriptional regulator
MTKRMSKSEERAKRVMYAVGTMEEGLEMLRDMRSELEDLRDSLEEHFGGTERFVKVEEAMQIIEDMVDACDTVAFMVDEIDFRW